MTELTGRAKGGAARAKTLSAERRKEISEKAVAAKREKASLLKATHGSSDHPVIIGKAEIPCYVLEDGTRVLSQRGILAGMKLSSGTAGGAGADRLSSFFGGKNISPYVSSDLMALIENPIHFRVPGGSAAFGYPATMLPDICDAILTAREEGKLQKQQMHIAAQCEILVRGFARVGIIALVDEATGYQKDRARDSLAKILEAFVAKEMQPYVKKFPAQFYEEMFRLRGLPFDPQSVKRPPYFGHLTNDIIYRRLAPGVWKELKAKAKKDLETKSATHLHRHLTPDVGDPRLKDMITKVTTVMQLSNQWGDFKNKLDRVAPAFDETLKIPFELENDDGRGI
jgi:hypothetical protein